jgi:hypothetical protein
MDEVKIEQDPDTMNIRYFSHKIISRSKFIHKGIQVEEVIANWEDGRKKLIWVRDSLEKMKVTVSLPGGSQEERMNPMAHSDYTDDPENFNQDTARRRVREAFDKHWGL